jgi:hypothetical protein
MRLWSLHPSLLDRAGLLALWREALLAQRVLLGQTRGYRFHPQLERFRAAERPVAAIATYLWGVQREAEQRGYRFDASKIADNTGGVTLQVTRGQLAYEAEHLRRKLLRRDPVRLRTRAGVRPHPMFVVTRGGIEPWERPKLNFGDSRRHGADCPRD